MNRLRSCICLSLLFSVSILALGCATTKYKPAEGNGPGYRNFKVSENKYAVTYKGTPSSSKDEVEKYILYRAAELTKAHGFDYFVVKIKDRDVQREIGPFKSPMTFGQFMPGAPEFPYFVSGFSWAAPEPDLSEAQFEATAFISMHKGSIPQRKPTSAYMATDVLESLKEKVD